MARRTSLSTPRQENSGKDADSSITGPVHSTPPARSTSPGGSISSTTRRSPSAVAIVSIQGSNGSAAAAASRRPSDTPVPSTVSAIKKPSFGNCCDRTADPDLSGLRMHFDRTRPTHFDSGSDGDIGIGYPKAAGEQANRACRGTRARILGDADTRSKKPHLKCVVIDAPKRDQAETTLSLDPPAHSGRSFPGRFLHEEFSEVNRGASVLPLACPAARPGSWARGRGFGVAAGPWGADRSGLVRPLRRAARIRWRAGAAIRARGASLRAGAG